MGQRQEPQRQERGIWQEIEKEISESLNSPFSIEEKSVVHGGDINESYVISGVKNGRESGTDQRFFVKINSAEKESLFVHEAYGLSLLSSTKTLRVPEVICRGRTEERVFLVLPFLDLSRLSSRRGRLLGQQLARLHQVSQKTLLGEERGFGLESHFLSGSTSQPNEYRSDWGDFFSENRIGHQLEVAAQKGLRWGDPSRLIRSVKSALNKRDLSHLKPSLLHGDLWGGNAAQTEEEPVIFDPNCYWGDREADLAMTELFGGFPSTFYEGYNEVFPLDSGYSSRRDLYNLYHLLVHANLFGGSYVSHCGAIFQKIQED